MIIPTTDPVGEPGEMLHIQAIQPSAVIAMCNRAGEKAYDRLRPFHEDWQE